MQTYRNPVVGNITQVIYPQTWSFNPMHTISFTPYRDWPQEKVIQFPEQYQPTPMPRGQPKYVDIIRDYPDFQYPYEVELEERVITQHKLQKQSEEDYHNKYENSERYYKYIPPNTDPRKYFNEKLKKSIDPMLGILKDMIQLEIDCENMRYDLCLQPDFQISKLYHQFYTIPLGQKENDGITVSEFTAGLKGFGIIADQQDIELLMTKHQQISWKRKKDDIYLDYFDFYNLFYPHSVGDVFSEKQLRDNKDDKFKRFQIRTNYLIDHLLRLMLSQEYLYERMRRQCQALEIDLDEMFNYMRNYEPTHDDLEINQLFKFFQDHGIFFQEKHIALLAFRMTKRLTREEIKLKDFKLEMTPRLILHQDIEADIDKQKKDLQAEKEFKEYMEKKTTTSLFDKKVTKDNLFY